MSEGQGRILEAALMLFREKSYASATIDEIVERADVSKGLVFYHFGSKSALLAAIVEPFLAALDQLLRGCEVRTEQEQPAILSEYFDLILEHIDAARLVHLDGTIAGEAEVGTRWESLRSRLRELLSTDEVAARAALGVLENPILRPSDPDRADVKEKKEELVKVAILALRQVP